MNMRKQSYYILFKYYSLASLVIFLREVAGASRIEFFRTTRGSDWYSRLPKRLVLKIISVINPRAEVFETPFDDVVRFEWDCNRDSSHLVYDEEENIRSTFGFKVARAIIGDGRIMRFFQGELSLKYPPGLIFHKLAEEKSRNTPACLIIADDAQYFINSGISSIRVILHTRIAWFARAGLMVAYLFFGALFPLLYLLKSLRRGIRFSIDRRRAKLAMPVLWGFPEEGKVFRGGVVRAYNDTYLYGGSIAKGDILHVFGRWQVSGELKKKYISVMNREGYAFIDKDNFKLTVGYVLMLAAVQCKLLLFMIGALCVLRNNILQLQTLKAMPKFLYYLFEKRLECENFLCKVELVKDDYNPGHVINSIVSSQRGVVTVGVQHVASPFDAPQLAFVCFDYYTIFGHIYKKMFDGLWKGINLVETGRESIDWLVSSAREQESLDRIKIKINDLYGDFKFIVTILFPGVGDRCVKSKWDTISEGLLLVAGLDVDFKVFMRFRNTEHIDHPKALPLKKIIASDRRFILDHENFVTQELISVSDLVITPNASFGINEAVAVGKKVVTFDFIGTGARYFASYGKDFVMTRPEQVLKAFQGLVNNFIEMDCAWDELSRDLNYHVDGRNSERLRQLIESI